MTTSTSTLTDYVVTRDQIISRALRICGLLGQGETATSTQLSEANFALNDIIMSFAADGMPLWKYKDISKVLTVGTASYTLSTSGGTWTTPTPLRVTSAWTVNSSNYSKPMVVITRSQYDMLGDKTAAGSVNQIWYDPPGALEASVQSGTLTLYPVPNVADTLHLRAVMPFEYFNAGTDNPDFPTWWNETITWTLAYELSFEGGLGLSERGMINNNATKHHQYALSYGTEQGSLYLQPFQNWNPRG